MVIREFLEGVPSGTLFTGDWRKHRELIESMVEKPTYTEGNDILAENVARCAVLRTELAAPEVLPLYLRPSQAERMFRERQG